MKKILSTIFIAILLIGFFSPFLVPQASAQAEPKGTCFITLDTLLGGRKNEGTMTYKDCMNFTYPNIPSSSISKREWDPGPSTKAPQGLCIPPGSDGILRPFSPTLNPFNSAEFACPGGNWDGTKIIKNGQIVSQNPSTSSTPSASTTLTDTKGTCYFSKGSQYAADNNGATAAYPYTKQECTDQGSQDWKAGDWTAGGKDIGGQTAPQDSSSGAGATRALFGQCWNGNFLTDFSVPGCITSWGYWLLVTIPSYILYETAYMFNVMLALTVGTVLYNNSFLPEAWRIVRDFSNIFFILVLLYIAIRMILGLGSDGKKMIVNVIIAALLINFSMFATELVIDSSNILALIFYNKIAVVRTPGDEGTAGDKDIANRDKVYSPVTTSKNGVEEKDIAAGIVSGFNPAHFINPSIGKTLNAQLDKNDGSSVNASTCAKSSIVPAIGIGCFLYKALSDATSKDTLPFAIALAIEVTAGAVFLFAAYAFFMAALAFIGRLIELWILIIFSPFAFMSLSVPQLSNLEYFGFEKWLDRLLKISFMAPIFMFFLLLITKLVQIDIFKNVLVSDNTGSTSIPRALLILTIPAIIYLSMLYKATEWAKKHSGDFGEAVIKYGKMATAAAGSIGLAAASGGASLALTNTVGRAAANISQNTRFQNWAASNKFGGFLSKRLSNTADRGFDFRNTRIAGVVGKSIEKNTGATILDRGKGGLLGRDKGSFVKKRNDRVKEMEDFAKNNLDTTEKEKAVMTRGGMKEERAEKIKKDLIRAGMDENRADEHKKSMMRNGLALKDLPDVTRHLDALKRELYADRKEKGGIRRIFNTGSTRGISDVFQERAAGRFRSGNMGANKVRTSVKTLEDNANLEKFIKGINNVAKNVGGIGGGSAGGGAAGAGGGGTPPPAGGGGGAHP